MLSLIELPAHPSTPPPYQHLHHTHTHPAPPTPPISHPLQGCLWRLVRASMTIVGLLPPMFEGGDLLVDGGYMNNLPVDVMRSLGVDTVIVVDVEGKDDTGWRNLTPYDGGVSGWRLLWDRWCPVPGWRFGVRMPRYSQIINQLTWMTHAHNLRRVSEDYRIDLYLRPPNIASYKLMDFHLMERIVKDAYRYASLAVSKWPLLGRVVAPGVGRNGQGAAVAAAAAAAQQPVMGPPPPSPLYVPASPMPPITATNNPGTPVWAPGVVPVVGATAGPRPGAGATAATTPPAVLQTAPMNRAGLMGGGATTAAPSPGRRGAVSPALGPHPTSSILCMSQLQKKVGHGESGGQQGAANGGPPRAMTPGGALGPGGLLTASSATAPPPSASAIAAGLLARTSTSHADSGQGPSRHSPRAPTPPGTAAPQAMQLSQQPVHSSLQSGGGRANGFGPRGPSSSGWGGGGARQEEGSSSRVGGGGGMWGGEQQPPQQQQEAPAPGLSRFKMSRVKTHQSLVDLAAMCNSDSD